MDRSPFGIAIYRPDGSVRTANRAMQRLWSLTDRESEFVIARYNILEDPELESRGIGGLVRKAFAGQPAILPRVEYQVETPLERRQVHRWLEGVLFPIHDSVGNLREVVSIQSDVSDLMLGQEQMHRSQVLLAERLVELEQLYATAPIGLCLMDTDLRYVRINDTLAGINGRPRVDHLGRTLREVLPEIADELEPVYRRVIDTGRPELNFAVHGTTPAEPDRERAWLFSHYPVRGDDGVVAGVGTVVQEITERKRAAEALRESQQRLHAVIDHASVVLWAMDRDGVFTLSEGKGLQALGLRPREVVGRSVFEVYADYPDVLEQNRRVLAGTKVSGTVEVGVAVFETRMLPLHAPDGSPDGAIGVAIDITERVRAEEAVRDSEQRFREIAENIREAFWLFDLEQQRVVYVSPAYERIWKRPVSDLYADVGEWERSVHPDDLDFARDTAARIVKAAGSESGEYRIVRPDGTVRWIRHRGFAVRDGEGRAVRIAGLAEDVTDRKLAEEERRQLNAKVQHSQKLESLGVLAGGIAHDFNNLLTGVLGNADLALQQLAPESAGREFLEKIRTTAQRASELTNQLLAYSGKGRFVVEAIDLNRLVREMSHLLKTVISKKADLRVDLADDLPAIEADASQIRQIVMNLITNASEAIGSGVGVIQVSTRVVHAEHGYLSKSFHGEALAPGPCVCLEVSDTGCGMSGETRSRIFDPFYTTKFTGRGLGLAAVLGIVRGHGAAIRVDSEIGRGSAMTVLFPPSMAEPASRERQPARRVSDVTDATVLVVDDDENVREVAQAILRNAGFRTAAAADGQEGVEMLERLGATIDLVLLDATMPRLDGEEAFRRMREIRPDVRVVLCSGYSEQEATNRFSEARPAGFIQKPYTSGSLIRKIRDALEES